MEPFCLFDHLTKSEVDEYCDLINERGEAPSEKRLAELVKLAKERFFKGDKVRWTTTKT